MQNLGKVMSKLGAAHALGLAAGISLLAVTLTGCGTGLSPALGTGSSGGGSVAHLRGAIHGGQQPVVGATIQLYTVGTSGLKSASTALLTRTITSDPNGAFDITSAYSCTSATQVYLTATGGNSGAGVNTAINMVAALGPCSALQANAGSIFININEVTTIASAYALAPFAADATHIGATGSNPIGLVNAMTGTFNNLSTLATGAAGGASLPTGAVVPIAEINTLADILAACVNTSSPSSSSCSSLMSASGASDTFGAALAFAKTPASTALLGLYSQVAAASPFQPTLNTAPTDWTLAINYNAGGTFKSPYAVAIDASGNAWVTNTAGNALTELSSAGTLLSNFTGGGLVGPKGLAIDRTGNVWVTNPSSNAVIEFNNSGVVQSGNAGYTGGGLSGPTAIALDSAGNAWIANLNGNTVTELNSAGAPTAANGTTGIAAGGTLALPTGIALDTTGNVYVSSNANGTVVKMTKAGAVAAGSPFSDGALLGGTGVALDSSNNVYVSGSVSAAGSAPALLGASSQFASSGTSATVSPVTAGGLGLPAAVATAGTDVWIVNKKTAGTLTQLRSGLSTPISPTTGFGSLNAPSGVAVDASGNVWTANSGDNTVSVFIGITTPVVTPLAANVGP